MPGDRHAESGGRYSFALPPWLADRTILDILSLIEGRFVGGVVRDAVLGRVTTTDIDVATPLHPEEVIRRLGAANIRTVPTGIAHGTVTTLAAAKDGMRPIEITTLRRDIQTDGRHAVVAYTDQWREDAARRDFTMNALYLDWNGEVWDFFGGVDDCLAGNVRFVGEPLRRLQEDVLRSLRFYRFLAHFGRIPPDPEARKACRKMAPALSRLSGERIRVELLKLLNAPDPVSAMTWLLEDDVWHGLFPAIKPRLSILSRLVPLEPAPDPLRRLAVMLPAGCCHEIADRLKCSTAERVRLAQLTHKRGNDPVSLDADDHAQRVTIYRLGRELYRDLVLIEAAIEDRPDCMPPLLSLASRWVTPIFPIRGADLTQAGLPAGPEIGRKLAAAEDWWVETDFTGNRAECLKVALNS